MNRFCPHCGHAVSPNAQFCHYCGYRLAPLQSQNMNQQAMFGRQPQSDYSGYYQDYQNQYQRPGRIFGRQSTFTDSGLNAYLIKVYVWMFVTLIVAGISAGVGASTGLFVGTWIPIIMAFIGWIPMWYVYRNAATDPAAGALGLMAFAVIDGLSLSGIFVYYTGSDLSWAFITSALVFASMCGIGMTTRRDLSQVRTQLEGALIALIIGFIITLIFANSLVVMFLSIAGVLIFAGFSIVDTNDAVKLYQNYRGQASVTGLALMSAMTLYIDFINLFIDLLEIIGLFNDNN